MSKKFQSEFAPKFKIGDKVRVKHGFMDVDIYEYWKAEQRYWEAG